MITPLPAAAALDRGSPLDLPDFLAGEYPFPWPVPLDYETGDLTQWSTTQDSTTVADGRRGLHELRSSDGRKFTSEALVLGPSGWYRLQETAGTLADDEVGTRDGTHQTGVTVNAAGVLAEVPSRGADYDGLTGYTDLGAGFDFSDPAKPWSVFFVCKPTVLDARWRALMGGATGAVSYGILSGKLAIAVAGVANLASPTGSDVTLNIWNYIGLSYDPTRAAGAVFRYFLNGLWLNGLGWGGGNPTPTKGVTTKYLGRLQANNLTNFQGPVDEALFFEGKALTHADMLTLREAASRSVDDASIVLPYPGVSQKGMSRVKVRLPNIVTFDAAERLKARSYAGVKGTTEWYRYMVRFPSSQPWNTDWMQVGGWGMTLCQLRYVGLHGPPITLDVEQPSYEGVGGNGCVVCKIQGGLSPVSGSEHQNRVDPALGNGWDTHRSFEGQIATGRHPQVLGPNTFLAGNQPFTLDVWHEFLMRVVWGLDQPGSFEVWHRVKSVSAKWVKTYEVFGIRTGQYDPARGVNVDGAGVTSNDKFGAYGQFANDMMIYHDEIGIYPVPARPALMTPL